MKKLGLVLLLFAFAGGISLYVRHQEASEREMYLEAVETVERAKAQVEGDEDAEEEEVEEPEEDE